MEKYAPKFPGGERNFTNDGVGQGFAKRSLISLHRIRFNSTFVYGESTNTEMVHGDLSEPDARENEKNIKICLFHGEIGRRQIASNGIDKITTLLAGRRGPCLC